MGEIASGILIEVNVAVNTGAGVNARKAREYQITRVGLAIANLFTEVQLPEIDQIFVRPRLYPDCLNLTSDFILNV